MASQEILIEVEPWEERVAVREAGMLTEFFLERPSDWPRVGSVYAGRIVSLLTSVGAALVDIGEGDAAFLPLRNPETGEMTQAARGQKVLVQVSKRPLGGKRAQVTQQLSLPGRLLVLMPGTPSVKVSRRIEDAAERARLEAVLGAMRPESYGLLARTAAQGKPAEAIRAELALLVAEWEALAKRAPDAPVPSCIRKEVPLHQRAVRDLCGPEVMRVRVAPGKAGAELRSIAAAKYPDMGSLLEVEESDGLFWITGLEAELEQLLERTLYLKSGGSLVFDFTEALTVIDVNSGHPFEDGTPEEVALRTNLEAAQEVPRQLKLRGIGGIIVVDFIDMPNPEHQKQMMEVLDAALKQDRVKTQVAVLSPLGVVEMTRKRVNDTPYHLLTETCPVCSGRGRTPSPGTVAILVGRKILRASREGARAPFQVRVNPRIGRLFREDSKLLRDSLKDKGIGEISVVDDSGLSFDEFRVQSGAER
jgi:ribonuclease G